MRQVVEELKNQDTKKEVIAKKEITSCKSREKNHKCIFEIIYVNDKICMATFREILDMKIIFKVLCSRLSLFGKEEIRRLALKWFHSDNGDSNADRTSSFKGENTNQKEQKNTTGLTQFVKINQKQENQNQAPENPNEEENNMSQFSEFSLEFDKFRKMNLNLLDF